jgi:8-oxo-dGTP diphosphatase
MAKIISVVCGIIRKDTKLFVALRKAEKPMGGYWEFPGGKIEPHETPEQALERELKEELGMTVKVREHFFTNVHAYENITIELIAYYADFISGSFTLTDHDIYEWKTPEELIDYKWAPADVPIFEKLRAIV